MKWLRLAVKALGAELLVSGDAMHAFVRRGEQFYVLLPKFLAVVDGASQYVSSWTDGVTHFGGWLPYGIRRWPFSTDKLVFKRFAQAAGLPVPAFSVAPDAQLRDVLVKRAGSSFGEQVRGPFREAAQCPLDVAQGDYYERFVEGLHLKTWFWNGVPVGAELDYAPSVRGDGISSLRQQVVRRATLLQGKSNEQLSALLARSEVLLKFHGRDLQVKLDQGERQTIEFRYGSDFLHPGDRRVVQLGQDVDVPWDELAAAGQKLLLGIPEAERQQVLFAVDAVIDTEGKLWLLEINSNPTVHPLAYPAMVASLFAQSPGENSVVPASQGHAASRGELAPIA